MEKYFIDPKRIQIDTIIGSSIVGIKLDLQGGRLDNSQHITLKRVNFLKVNTEIFHVSHAKLLTPIGFLQSKSNNRTVTKQIAPFLTGGSLSDFLHAEAITVAQAVEICIQIAHGMRYLEHLKINHGRLSCRNVLIKDRKSGSVLINDFGLGDMDLVYAPFHLPSRKLSVKNDVWAFGMTILEIFNGGQKPFSGISDEAVLRYVQGQTRPGKSEDCPQCVYELALRCLVPAENERPTFSSICTALDNIHLALTQPDFELRMEIFSSIESSDDEPDIDDVAKQIIHSNIVIEKVMILSDPKSKSAVLKNEQISQLPPGLIRPGCTKPYPSDTDLVWLDKNLGFADVHSYALIPSSSLEKETDSETRILSFFKHQVGLFNFETQLWDLIVNPEQDNASENKTLYEQMCNPCYPVTFDANTSRLYGLITSRSGVWLRKFEPFGMKWTSEDLKPYLPSIANSRAFSHLFSVSAFALVFHENSLYMIGGYNYDTNKVLGQMYKYDLFSKTWESMPPMPVNRMFHKAFIADNCIFVTGGCTLDSQRYDTPSEINCLTGMFSSFWGASFPKKLSANEQAHDYDRVDVFDFEQNKWKTIDQQPGTIFKFEARRRHAITQAHGKLYVAGGISKDHILQSFQFNDSFVDELDDYHENAWVDLPDMPTARYDLGLETITRDGKEMIYAVGGVHHDSSGNVVESGAVEAFNLETNQWTVISMLGLSNFPLLADGFGGSCVCFPCYDTSIYEMVLVTYSDYSLDEKKDKDSDDGLF